MTNDRMNGKKKRSIIADHRCFTRNLILVYFLTTETTSKTLRRNTQMDIQLLKEHQFYLVQVTNCGPLSKDVTYLLNFVFLPLVTDKLMPNNIAIAYLFSRTAGKNSEIVYDVKVRDNYWMLDVDTVGKELINFPYLKEYLSIKLQYALLPCNLESFKELLINKISVFQRHNPDIKFTFHHAKEIFYTNYVKSDDDFKNCQLLSSALTAVIKQSLSYEFRESCFRTLRVDNSYDAESAIMNKLLPMIQQNYIGFEREI